MKTKTVNRTKFTALPVGERRHAAVDDKCCCMYCSADGTAQDNPNGVWDTLAEDLDTGRTWLVHMPELHGRRRLRKEA